ncbi:MAG: DUF3836 domain-containing protein [Bacteroides sp.]
MKATTFKKAFILSALILISNAFAFAGNISELVYNTEERNGVMVSQLVYKMDEGKLSNHEKYNYTYDSQKRMQTQEKQVWNARNNKWENNLCISYSYQNGKKNVQYSKWNKKSNSYILVPEMTVSVSDTETIR